MPKYSIDEQTLTDISNAIRNKSGSDKQLKVKDFASSIDDITISINSYVIKKDVNFYDYDGTLLYSYTVEEAQALLKLPDLPSHEGLICQGWNYDLETIKSYNRSVDIGAMYITDDGKTRLYIRIAAEGRMTVPLYFSQTKANGVTIDWGDRSATQTLSGTGDLNTTHTYASIGDYVITLEVLSGCTLELGYNTASYGVMGATSSQGRVYCNMLQKVEIGTGVKTICNYAFKNCHSLASVTIPNSVTNIYMYAFTNCYSLVSINIPDSVTALSSNAFEYCPSLVSISLPDSVTKIESDAFYDCYSLASVTIPDSVTKIGSNAFYDCNSLASVTMSDSVTSIGTYAFRNCESLASIRISNSVTSISNNTFLNCYSIASVTIPSSVTSIGSSAFQACYGMAVYDFTSHTSIPTLSNKNAFSSIPSDCVIKVPAALYDDWIAATNWSTYASQIVAV